MQDPLSVFSNNSRQIGIRVKLLPPGTVMFEMLVQENVEGIVIKLPYREMNGRKITVSSFSYFSVLEIYEKPRFIQHIPKNYNKHFHLL